MPPNPNTGKTDRRAHNGPKILKFRIDQALKKVVAVEGEESPSEVKKGKRRALDPPEAGDLEGSGQTSPAAQLAGLENLSLESESGSSPAGTPADLPAPLSQPPLPARPDPAPPSAPSTHDASKSPAGKSVSNPPFSTPAQHLTGVTAEVPGPSRRVAFKSPPAGKSVSKASLSAPAQHFTGVVGLTDGASKSSAGKSVSNPPSSAPAQHSFDRCRG